jgi:hypothetical protein
MFTAIWYEDALCSVADTKCSLGLSNAARLCAILGESCGVLCPRFISDKCLSGRKSEAKVDLDVSTGKIKYHMNVTLTTYITICNKP